ncbi:hypothetical protein MMH89_00970 [Candidatus Comchoanobacter bicostacola]|uniref:Uncharacterized protein n=1 Tax=Candidatus Comchoanobacter bicostacola TaxID=2919598 RepID=A0ABY5DM16_9GAMM|nr:hypothetical protein [Candidatus Comchoanobacter bicostacola]UTC24732.1 hypothetical protein MMH89_00970 [Candidatus Comchoanobacter bicostacola]
MNGIRAPLNLHVYALFWTVSALCSVVLLIKQVIFAQVLFYFLLIVGGGGLAYWFYDLQAHADNRLLRSALCLGAFGLSMLVFSYVMVPLYHILCHGVSASNVMAGQSAVATVDVLARSYRNLPVRVFVDKDQISLAKGGAEQFWVTLKNDSTSSQNLKLLVVTQPREWRSSIHLVMPDYIKLEPNQLMKFPLEVVTKSPVSSDRQVSMMLLLQDTKDTGLLGKTDSWRKMVREYQG